jgi:lysophospholipase L1-like esterase
MHLFINPLNKSYSAYKSVNPLIGKKYFKKLEATGGTNDIFLKKKPENGFRIFVLGSSTVVGFPYSYNLMFSRILHMRLQDAYPDKHIEVVNTAITAINSFSLLDYMNEIVKYEPDALLIYAGHNEFYGAFGIASHETLSRNRSILNIHFKLLHLRIYQLMRNSIYGIINLFSKSPDPADERGTLMKRMVADKEIVYKSEKYTFGIRQYDINMSQIFKIARKHNIPVFISDLVSNIRDLKPFGSIKTDSIPGASDVFNEAKQNENEGDFQKAKKMYYRAKDLDCVRFRASEEINDIIRTLAKEYSSYLVPMQSYFEQSSPNGLIGNNLLTEHVHPNIDGYFLMSSAFYDKIVQSKIIGEQPNLYKSETSEYNKRNWGYTELDSLIGLHKINHLKSGWPFRSENEANNYRRTYKPFSALDSLAFSIILHQDITAEKIHKDLADKYMAMKDYFNCYREYHALICINPYSSEYYLQAASCLLYLNDLYSAMQYYRKSIEFKPTYLAWFMLGEIGMIKQNYKMAVEGYENALKLSDDASKKNTILTRVYIAYYYNGMQDKSKEIISELKKDNPMVNTSIPTLAYDYLNYIPFFVKNEIETAKRLLSEGKNDSALVVLQNSLQIRDTPLANMYIGDILYSKKDKNLLYYYLKAYPDFDTYPVFLDKLCIAYLVNKNTTDANLIIQKLRELAPDNPETLKLEKLIGRMKSS